MEPCAKSVSVSDYPFAPSNSPTYLSPTAALPTPYSAKTLRERKYGEVFYSLFG